VKEEKKWQTFNEIVYFSYHNCYEQCVLSDKLQTNTNIVMGRGWKTRHEAENLRVLLGMGL
jgi:hypothetical protein